MKTITLPGRDGAVLKAVHVEQNDTVIVGVEYTRYVGPGTEPTGLVELNATNAAELVEWLTSTFDLHGHGKMTTEHMCAQIQYEGDNGLVHSDACISAKNPNRTLMHELLEEFLNKWERNPEVSLFSIGDNRIG